MKSRIARSVRRDFYPVVDALRSADYARYGIKRPAIANKRMSQHRNLRAVETVERRPPRAGEFYLSGSPVEAYRAPSDLVQSFIIARIVLTKTIATTHVVWDADDGGPGQDYNSAYQDLLDPW